MGLDMYLEKQWYVKNWEHTPPEKRHEVTVLKGGQPTKIQPKRVMYIVEQVMYWRKANQIHAWFVKHVQHGTDDCGTYSVSRNELQELRDACATVLEDHSQASILLPSQEGFFFGHTDYDEFYFADLEETHIKLAEILAEDTDDHSPDFQYHSSW